MDGVLGVAVCKDMDFSETIRASRADGIGLMLVPAWDFDRDGWLHARMAVLRGVEGGFGVVRSAKQGMLTVSDDRGRVLAERRSADGPFPTLLAAAPLGRGPTVYAHVGDAFGWANLVAMAGLCSRCCAARSRGGDARIRPTSAKGRLFPIGNRSVQKPSLRHFIGGDRFFPDTSAT